MGLQNMLLDTTYILPILGIKVPLKNYETLFPTLLERFEVVYNPLSIVEAKWITLSLIRRLRIEREPMLERFVRGLKVLLNDERLKSTLITAPETEENADKLLDYGVKDYFDRMILSTAKNIKCNAPHRRQSSFGSY